MHATGWIGMWTGCWRSAASTAIVLILAMTVFGCGPPARPPVQANKPPSPEEPPKRVVGRMIFDCQPRTARVVVDGQDRGSVDQLSAQGGLELPMGLHRVEIVHEGFQTFRFELILEEKPETIRVQLKPIAPKGSP